MIYYIMNLKRNNRLYTYYYIEGCNFDLSYSIFLATFNTLFSLFLSVSPSQFFFSFLHPFPSFEKIARNLLPFPWEILSEIYDKYDSMYRAVVFSSHQTRFIDKHSSDACFSILRKYTSSFIIIFFWKIFIYGTVRKKLVVIKNCIFV